MSRAHPCDARSYRTNHAHCIDCPAMQDWRALTRVFVVAPGAPGGMASLVASTAQQWRAARLQPELRLLDSYGARLSPLSAGFFARAWRRWRGTHAAVASRCSTCIWRSAAACCARA